MRPKRLDQLGLFQGQPEAEDHIFAALSWGGIGCLLASIFWLVFFSIVIAVLHR